MKNKLTTILVACAIFGCNNALAADRSITERKIPLEVPRASSAIVLDGVLDEAAWQDALRVTLDWETYPAENIDAFAMTEGFVTYSNDTLYVAFIAHDPDPSKIRAHLTDRDRMFQDDFAGVVLDTFNDERRGFEFFVNPLGVQGDLFKDDIAGNEDSSFDTIWDSVGRITDEGYIIEIAIPFYSLRFKGSAEPIIWGIDFVRIMPRDERHQFRTYKADRNLACYICEFQKYRGFAGADPGNNLEIVPTFTAARSDQRPDYDEPYERGDSEFEPSVDVKWGITPNIILNATLNPDFSQVEADIAQLEVNNQFALFYPERRTFFLEGQDIFDDPFGIVYTRNIADPDHGAKITGKEGNHVFGAFFTDDSLTNLIFPGPLRNEFESFEFDSKNAVARYRFDLGENSTLGALATDRSGDGYRNSVLAIDSKIRLSDSDTLNFEIIESETEYSDQMVADFAQPAGQFTDTSVYAGYSRNAREHNFYVEYVEVGEDFRADLGFLPQVGYKQPVIGGGYIWHGDGDDWYRRIRLNGDIDQTHDTATGQELETEAEAYLSMNSGMQSYLELGAIRRRQFWDGVMYQQTLNQFFGEFQPSAAVYANFYVRHGDSIDYANSRAGRQLQINPELTLRPGRQLNADLRFTYDRLNVDGGRLFTARITELRTTWQFTAQMFVRWITQYRTLDREAALYTFAVEPNERSWGNQLLFSYKLNPRTLFFAGYSDGYAGSHELDLQRQHKTLFFKFSYAWQL